MEASEFESDEFYIIFDGLVVVEALIDQTDFISIDYLARGSIIRPYHFLVNRSNTVKYTVLDTALIYSMRLETLALLSMDYPELKQALAPVIEKERERKFIQTFPVDYIKCGVRMSTFYLSRRRRFDVISRSKVDKTIHQFKQVVVALLIKMRRKLQHTRSIDAILKSRY